MASGASTGGKVLTGCSCLSIFIFLSRPLTALSERLLLSERLSDMLEAGDSRDDAPGLVSASRRPEIGSIQSVALLRMGHRAAGSAA